MSKPDNIIENVSASMSMENISLSETDKNVSKNVLMVKLVFKRPLKY